MAEDEHLGVREKGKEVRQREEVALVCVGHWRLDRVINEVIFRWTADVERIIDLWLDR